MKKIKSHSDRSWKGYSRHAGLWLGGALACCVLLNLHKVKHRPQIS